ncbi:MAG: helix-hairpin-helix domain-containing protein [Actinobacteria bacterium]|nr:helix-hairpin-helix domain-containing protein [Actinomycetota bacterium]
MNLRDKLNKIAFKFLSFRYEKSRQFHISVFMAIIIVIIILSLLTIRQNNEMKVKENVLKAILNSSKNPETAKNTDDTFTDSSFEEKQTQETTAKKIKVYICGEINNAGVYELSENTRIVDLIEIAGGVKEDAYLDSINLAEILIDSQKVYIPSKKEASALNINNEFANSESRVSQARIININIAGKNELELLPGIGPELAQRIIDYRNSKGFFKRKEDLKNVTGIGDKKFNAIKDLIIV